MRKFCNNSAQTLLDYVILIGIVATIFFTMNVGVRRGVQAIVKGAADHIGTQENAEQDFEGRSGYLVNSVTNTRASMEKNTSDFLGTVRVDTNDRVETTANSLVNLGFTERTD